MKYSNRIFSKVAPLLREGTKGWGKAWRDEIIRVYSSPDAEAYVVEDGRKIIGTVFLKREVSVLALHFLTIKKEARGKGVGGSLINFVETMARKEKRILRVDVAKEFGKNADFYVKLGFKRCGLVKNFYMAGDEQIFLCKKP
jgi:ribosomal protein S18 acetylase RimI-like enzyme